MLLHAEHLACESSLLSRDVTSTLQIVQIICVWTSQLQIGFHSGVVRVYEIVLISIRKVYRTTLLASRGSGGVQFPEQKHYLTVECACSFTFETTDQCNPEILKMFSVAPQKGTLSAVDRPAQVQVIFKSTKEVTIKDQPILRCRVIEPNIGEEGEIIASIPIKLSVKSVYSKYVICLSLL